MIHNPMTSEWAITLLLYHMPWSQKTQKAPWVRLNWSGGRSRSGRGNEEGSSSSHNLKGAHTASSPDWGAQAPAPPSCVVSAAQRVSWTWVSEPPCMRKNSNGVTLTPRLTLWNGGRRHGGAHRRSLVLWVGISGCSQRMSPCSSRHEECIFQAWGRG